MAERTFYKGRALETFINVFGPMLIPAIIAVFTVFLTRKQQKQRIASFVFGGGVAIGLYTGRAEGVSFNCFFTALIGMCILIGIFVSSIEQKTLFPARPLLQTWTRSLIFLWFLIPVILHGSWDLIALYRHGQEDQSLVREQVSIIHDSNGPALCESLLRCYLAGKPYLYDPFNATRLIRVGRLPEGSMISKVRAHRFGVIEMTDPVDVEMTYRSEHFTHDIVAAIKENYVLIYQHGRESIYAPAGLALKRLGVETQ